MKLTAPALQCVQLDSGARTAFELAHAGVPVETSAALESPLLQTAAIHTWPLVAVMLLIAPASELPQVRRLQHAQLSDDAPATASDCSACALRMPRNIASLFS